MAISHVSEVIKSNPWIQPFDIELMAKVNSYKQGEFYKNAAKIENMVTQLNNADIANPEQREYLKSKVSNLTTQLNKMGAINYSDTNIANTIEGFGSEIYADDRVLNGIQSTKSIREWQANVQKLKTDPKLSKYYNGANEAYDYEHYIKPYVSGGLEAKYEGPRAPKPYTGNPFTKVMEQLKTVRPDITTSIDPVTGNPFFFSKTENRRLTPEDISAAVDGFIDGDTKQQLQIDAWYNYDYTTGNKFTKDKALDVYTQDLDNVVANRTEELRIVNEQIASEPDINKKKDWEDRAKQLQDQLNTYNTQRTKMVDSFGKQFDADPKNAKYQLYMTRFQQDIIKAAGFSETKISLIKNEERMFNARMQLEYTKNGLHWDGVSYNHDGTPLVRPVSGAESMVNKGKDGTGKTTVDIAGGIFHDITQNTESGKDARANKVSEETLLRDNAVIDNDLTNRLRTFLESTAKRGGYDLGFVTGPQTNAGSAAVGSYSPLLEAVQNIGNKALLERSDIERVVQGAGNNGATVTTGGKTIGVTKEQVNFFRNVLKNWDAVATGQLKADEAPMNISVSDLSQFVNDYQTLNQVKASNLAYIDAVKKQAFEGSGLTPAQIKRYQEFLNNPDMQGRTITSGKGESYDVRFIENAEWARLNKIVKSGKIKDRMKAAFDNASNRDNYYSLYLPEPEIVEKVAPGVMNKIRGQAALARQSIENLTPNSITRTADGEFVLGYTAGPDKKPYKGEVKLDAAEAMRLGAQLYPNEALERLLTYDVTTGPMYTYSPIFKQPIKYSIEREGNSRNGRTYIPYIYYGNERIPVFAPDKKGFQGSANAAEQLLKQYITKNSATSIEEFIEGLKTLRNY